MAINLNNNEDYKNINYYLTNNTKEIYKLIIDICKNIENISNSKIYIFGGFIRNLIENYHNPESKFKFNDIDIWFYQSRYDNLNNSFTRWKINVLRNIVPKLRNIYKISDQVICYSSECPRELYGLYKVNINDINFDFSTNINSENQYKKLSDYTVNNLTMDTEGNLYTRIDTQYTIDNIIEHIKNKKLIKIINSNVIDDYIHYLNDNKEYYIKKMNEREQKMINYGYN